MRRVALSVVRTVVELVDCWADQMVELKADLRVVPSVENLVVN